MKKQKKFIKFLPIALGCLGLIMALLLAFFLSRASKDKIIQEAQSSLNNSINFQGKKINNYFDNLAKSVEAISKSKYAKDVLKNNPISNFALASNSIEQRAKSVALQIEKYLKDNPGLTLEILQDDPEFQNIAVQLVGATGYTAVHEAETLINRFHVNPKIINLDLRALEEKLPEFWSIIEKNQQGRDGEGFYDWQEADGSVKRKFMYTAIVKETTADNISLGIAATTYLDEFEFLAVEEELNNYFNDLLNISDYQDILFITPEGKIAYTVAKRSDIGTDLEIGAYQNSNLAEAYLKAKASRELKFSNYDYYPPINTNALFIISPVLKNNNLLGFVAVEIQQEQVNNLIELQNISPALDLYLINQDYLLLTPSRFLKGENRGVLTQLIKNENSEECFEKLSQIKTANLNLAEFKESKVIIKTYLEYTGEESLGIYSPIIGPNWCLLAVMKR